MNSEDYVGKTSRLHATGCWVRRSVVSWALAIVLPGHTADHDIRAFCLNGDSSTSLGMTPVKQASSLRECHAELAEASRRRRFFDLGNTPIGLARKGVKVHISQRDNFFANPSFEWGQPPPLVRSNVGKTSFASDELVPRCWQLNGKVTCPLDETKAHTGRRALLMTAPSGACEGTYHPLPRFVGPRTIRFYARGTGTLHAAASTLVERKWQDLNSKEYQLTSDWRQYVFECPQERINESWKFHLGTVGETVAWVDDFSLDCPQSNLDGLPPHHPLQEDQDTSLYLDFETPLDPLSYFVKGEVSYTENEMPGFGKALHQGRDACVAGDAEEAIDPRQGTIECWVKLLSPGNDTQNRSFLRVPGMDGMGFGKNQYGHLSFGFSKAWRPLGSMLLMGRLYSWRPHVWHHLAVTWDSDMMQCFIDGALAGWTLNPELPPTLGAILEIGDPGVVLDELRISRTVRYRVPVFTRDNLPGNGPTR